MGTFSKDCFSELELNKDYIVELHEVKGPQHIRVLFKGECTCLVEIIDPNENETVKRWYSYGQDIYDMNGGEMGLYAVYEELTGYTRGKKIDNLLGGEKEK